MNERERPHSNSGALVIELFCVAVTWRLVRFRCYRFVISQLPFKLEVILSAFLPKSVERWVLGKICMLIECDYCALIRRSLSLVFFEKLV